MSPVMKMYATPLKYQHLVKAVCLCFVFFQMSALNSVLYLHTITFRLLLHPSRGAEHCDKFVCLCVCLSVCEHISGTAELFLTKFFVQILCGCGSILLCWRYDTLCTSGFMDDVTFGRSGPYGDA